MLGQFAISILTAGIFIVLPGYVFLRSLKCKRFLSVSFAPLFTILFYVVLGISFSKLSLFSSGLIYFAIALGCAGVFFLVLRLIRGKKADQQSSVVNNDFQFFGTLGIYVGVSVVLGCLFFVGNISSPDAVFQAYDNIYHLAVTKSFVDSGDWSILSVTLFETASFDPPVPSNGSFYPASWHILCSMLVSVLSISIPMAANAVNFTFAFILFPMSTMCLLLAIFGSRKTLLLFGAAATCAFGSFPWGFLTFGPLYPNLASFSLLPLLIAAFIWIFKDDQSGFKRVFWVVCFVAGVGTMAATQPNAVFTVGVFLTPFCLYKIYLTSEARFKSRKYALICAAGFVVFVCAFWWFLYNAPFMQATLSQLYPRYYSKLQSLLHLLSLWFMDSSPNVLLGLLVIIGAIYTFKYRQYLWLVFSYALAAGMYLVDASCVETSFIKNLLTGFWYSDIYRIEAMLGLFGIPLACLGLYAIFQISKHVISKRIDAFKRSNVLAGAIAVVGLLLLYLPVMPFVGSTQFGSVESNISEDYSISQSSVLSDEENAFLGKVKPIVGDDLVINLPDDGSAFAYPIADINTYYRNTRTYGTSSESEESRTIRESLCEVSESTDVQNSLSHLGAKYVLLLDQGTTDEMPALFTWDFYSFQWEGLSQITDSTPGLKVVLAEGDMRLYEIETNE